LYSHFALKATQYIYTYHVFYTEWRAYDWRRSCHSGKRPVVTGLTGPNYNDWSWSCGAHDGTVSSTQAGSTSLGVGH